MTFDDDQDEEEEMESSDEDGEEDVEDGEVDAEATKGKGKGKRGGGYRGATWTGKEDECLIDSWSVIRQDTTTGSYQTSGCYWKRNQLRVGGAPLPQRLCGIQDGTQPKRLVS